MKEMGAKEVPRSLGLGIKEVPFELGGCGGFTIVFCGSARALPHRAGKHFWNLLRYLRGKDNHVESLPDIPL